MANKVISISEFKKNPMKIIRQGQGQPIAVLSRNQTVYYIVPPDLFEQLIENGGRPKTERSG